MRETRDPRPLACPCAAAACAPLPEKLADLVALAGTQALDLGLAELALVGTCFDNAQILTRNAGALIQGRGGYAAFQPCGSRFRANRRRVTIRVNETRAVSVLRSPEMPARRMPATISVVDAAGVVGHRIQLLDDADRLKAQSLPSSALDPMPEQGVTATRQAANVVSLAGVRQARQRWTGAHLGDHLDDLVLDAGQARLSCLPYLGRARARRVATSILPSFLDFLCHHRAGFSATLPFGGMAQSMSAQALGLRRAGSLLICETDAGLFLVDMALVGQGWVTRLGTAGAEAALELYDHDGRCLLLLHGDPWSNATNWASYLEAMPGA